MREEERYLVARLEGIRALITHPGEKGRALEGIVTDFLKSILPAEYGISTGFVVYETKHRKAQLSPQFDIAIYDALSSGPIARVGDVSVFPLEAVYACVEVKASIKSSSRTPKPPEDSIEHCVAINKKIREMTIRRYWVPSGSVESKQVRGHRTPIRHYIFAFEAKGRAKEPEWLKSRLETAMRQFGSFREKRRLKTYTHVHGVLIANQVLLYTKSVDSSKATKDDLHKVGFYKNNALARFKLDLLIRRLPFAVTICGSRPSSSTDSSTRCLARLGHVEASWSPDLARYYRIGDINWSSSD